MTGRKWLVTALIVSVTLNIFLGSIFAGRALFDGPAANQHSKSHSHHHDRSSLRMELKALDHALSDDAQRALRATLHEKRAELQPVFADITEKRREIRQLLSTDQIDRAALNKAVGELNQLLGAIQAPLQGIIIDAASRMTPQQRKKMADILEEMEKRRYHGSKTKKDQSEKKSE